MLIKFNSSERVTIENAVNYFDIFYCHEVPFDESEWTESHECIHEISTVLDDLCDRDAFDTPQTDLSLDEIKCLLSAFSVYRSIVQNDVKTTLAPNRSKHEKELTLNNIDRLYDRLYAAFLSLKPTTALQTFNVSSDTNYL